MDKKQFDLVVIGAGPGGYVAAIKASQAGKKVALVEKQYMGGTCLNVGCIPTKTMIANALMLRKIKHAHDFGIEVGSVSFDYSKMKARKDKVVSGIKKSLEGLVKTNGVTIFQGTAEFTDLGTIKVSGETTELLSYTKAIIATGSAPLDIKAFPCDHKKIFDSTSILELTDLPKSIAIIGGGYIGCEFASMFAELGVKVFLVEALPAILRLQGSVISETMTKAFQRKGIEIITGATVKSIDTASEGVTLHFEGRDSLHANISLVSIGRKIVSSGLGLEKVGLTTDAKGAIPVNDKMETSTPGIYAIGDVTGTFLLAHVASHQGCVAAANACGQEATMHYHAVPSAIFTHPEVGAVGMTQEEATEAGLDFSVGKFPFQALGKSVATMEVEGFAQVLSEKRTGRILGALVIGEGAASLISEMALAIQNELTVECIAETIHAHPTLPEAWHEATLLSIDSPIHFPPKARKG